MSVIVTGSRNWPEECFDKVWRVLDVCHQIDRERNEVLLVLEGGAPGADKAARTWVRKVWLDAAPHQLGSAIPSVFGKTFRADFDRIGPSAGPIRNRTMLEWAVTNVFELGLPLVLAFPMLGSRGTIDCMNAARDRGITVLDATMRSLDELKEVYAST